MSLSVTSNECPLPDAGVHGEQLRRSLGLVTLAWVFGSVWMTATSGAPLTRYAQGLGATEFEFGLLAAMPFIASMLSMPSSLLIDRTGKRKTLFLCCLYSQRLMWVPIALVPFYVVSHYGRSAMPGATLLFLAMIFIMHSCNAVGGPAWTSWMADLIPERSRSKYLNRRRQFGILSALPAAFLAGWGLDRVYPGSAHLQSMFALKWCAIVFICASVFGVTDIHMFQYVPEITAPPKKNAGLFGTLAGPLRNRQFLWFAGFVGTLTFSVSFMGQFVTLYLIAKLNVTNLGVNLITLIAPSLAQLLVLPAWGRAVDRMGKKPVMAIASLGLVPIALGWCFMNSGTGSTVWLGYVLSAAGAALWTGVETANQNIVFQFAASNGSDGGGSSYVAVNSVIINIAGCMGGLTSGLVAQKLRSWSWDPVMLNHWLGLRHITFYEVLFALSGILRLLAAVVFLPFIDEPEARPTYEVLRFMSSNIYNNLFGAMSWPLKMVKARRPDETASVGVRLTDPPPDPLPDPLPVRRAA